MTVRITSDQSSPTVRFQLEADAYTDATYGTNGRWRVRLLIRAINTGTSGSNYAGSGYQDGRTNGTIRVTYGPVTPFLPSVAAGATRWERSVDVYINANSNGYWSGSSVSMPVQMGLDYGSINTTPAGAVPMPRIARAPGAPGTPTITAIQPTGATLTWTAAARGNANITKYEVQYALNSAFTTGAVLVNAGTDLTETLATLNPGTVYYVRVRAVNGDGTGAWGGTASFTTIVATGPGMSVTAGPSGTSATVALTPPGGTTGVTAWTIEYRLQGSPTTVTIPLTAPVNSAVVTGLTPGAIYEWRSNAIMGTYTSPWTDWLAVQQPNPNTNPGDYFDGSTVPPVGSSTVYAWTGAVNNSISTASLPTPTGWMNFADGAFTSGGTGVVARATGGAELPGGLMAGAYSARVVFKSDAAAAGFRAGTSHLDPGRTDVQGEVDYIGSMYVFLPNRQQLLAAEITWVTAAGAFVGANAGTPQLVPAGAWTRLMVQAEAPPTADFAAIRIVDVAGTGWSTWKGGDVILLDAAMISVSQVFPYFDGSFADDGTYTYDWLGTANASQSQRTLFLTPAVDPLIDPLCPPVPLPPRPPVVLDDCIEDIPVWRRYWYTIPASEISDWLTEIPTLIITSGNGGNPVNPQGARQIRIRIYPNPFGYPPETIDTASYCSEQIISYMPPYTTMTLDGPLQRVFAEVSGSATLNADHLLYGTGGIPATWPELSCGISYLVSVDEPLESPAGNIDTRILLTRRT